MKFYSEEFGELKTDRNGMIVPTRAGTRARARRRLTLDEGEQRPVFRLICGFAAILAVGVLYVNYAETVHLWTMSAPQKLHYLEMQGERDLAAQSDGKPRDPERGRWLFRHAAAACMEMYQKKATDLTMEETDLLHSACQGYLP